MSDWQVGDLAVCVDGGADDPVLSASTLLQGGTYRVGRSRSIFAGDWRTAARCFVGFADGTLSRFRKIRPDEHEACEPEFVTLLKRTKVRA
jgi:hypothetical protein